MPPTLSVIINTYNRAAYLDLVIPTLLTQNHPSLLEIVIVDNNSRDNTRQIAEKWQKQSTVPIVYTEETRQGTSFARNRGVEVARGEIVAFIDDDALAEPDWVKTLLEPYTDPEIWAVGGRVDLEWGKLKRPAWLTHLFTPSLSAFSLKYTTPVSVTHPGEFPHGGNLSYRRAIFLAQGGFDTKLGRVGNSLQEGEEMDLQRRLVLAGGKIIYHPQMIIRHFVFEEKIRKAFYYRFYWGKAVTTYRNYLRDQQAGRLRSFWHFSIRIGVWGLRALRHASRADLRFYCWLQAIMNFHATVLTLTTSSRSKVI